MDALLVSDMDPNPNNHTQDHVRTEELEHVHLVSSW